MAKLQSLVKDLPEFIHILAGGACHIHQIQGHNTLVETSVILRLLRIIIERIGHIFRGTIRCQEAPAAHAYVHIALPLGINLELAQI